MLCIHVYIRGKRVNMQLASACSIYSFEYTMNETDIVHVKY